MRVVSDLHLHSKYSRAVSQNMTAPIMAQVAKKKGIDLLATSDWTHPLWLREIRNYLTEAEEGLYKIKNSSEEKMATRFLLSVEISCIYSQGGKGRRIHNLVLAPNFETVEKINREFLKRGYNLTSDGRPIIGLSSKNLLELILEVNEHCLLIPCHIWTPWFGLYGMQSGFNSIEESFEDLSKFIYGIETGLSSDPEMNWQINELNTRSILSFSDAHSPAKMGREATVFELDELSYENIRQAIMLPFLNSLKAKVIDAKAKNNLNVNSTVSSGHNKNRVLYTIEFYPEEGKYHYSGHRNCQVSLTPDEQRQSKGICTVCKRTVTDGVMRRVQELASSDPRGKSKLNDKKLKWYVDPHGLHPPFIKLVPLIEIIAEAMEVQVTSVRVKDLFESMVTELGSELDILQKIPVENIEKLAGAKVAEGVQIVREGNLTVIPGFDGVYGIVKLWNPEEKSQENSDNPKRNDEKAQLGLEF